MRRDFKGRLMSDEQYAAQVEERIRRAKGQQADYTPDQQERLSRVHQRDRDQVVMGQHGAWIGSILGGAPVRA